MYFGDKFRSETFRGAGLDSIDRSISSKFALGCIYVLLLTSLRDNNFVKLVSLTCSVRVPC